ncbi:MAG: hypothetical protein JNN12_00770 [Bacteroidetes Order II. Incertae sedis bacterium]|nr:hypothetical protein [Bacteroidetes Order II. bacterium]
MNSKISRDYGVMVALFMALIWAGCDIFAPRIPESPIGTGGSWLQPDTPDRVVENLKNAIAERNVQHYAKSLAVDLVFQPSITAENRDPVLWTKWGSNEEETYFARLATASAPFTGHNLQLIETSQVILDNRHISFQATYILRMQHSRSNEGIPIEANGKLVWNMVQQTNGLWQIERWADQGTGSTPSWSDLKAAFVK